MTVKAMERCAYCRREVPVTWHDVSGPTEGSIVAQVAVCEECFANGR